MLEMLCKELAIDCVSYVLPRNQILSLFERFPLGLLPGHFYALLRLASWVQQGEAPSKTILFTQTEPPRIRSESGSGELEHSLGETSVLSDRSHRNSMPPSSTIGHLNRNTRSVPPPAHLHERNALLASSTGMQQRQPVLQEPLLPVREISVVHSNDGTAPPPVPDDSHKPTNPFRPSSQTPHLITPHISVAPPPSSSMPPMGGAAIMGFDPAPNPFRQSKPKLVKPTPIVADSSTQVLGRPSSAAIDPFKSGQSVSSRGGSSVSGRSLRELSPVNELKPPPLPPRHISPLIQAGLNARIQVKKKQEALPPKTFTVLQSTQSRHPAEKPRLLTGQAAPPPLPSKRRSITDTRISGSSITGGQGDASTSRISDHVPDRRVGPLPAPIAPKPSYGGKSKTGVPAWLREQEELQKTTSLDHHNEPSTPPRDGHNRSASHSKRTKKKRTTSEAQRIQFLDDDSSSSENEDEGTLSEQARSAASIDRNNPFFQHGRDVERSVDLEKTLGKLAVENAVAKAEHDSRMSVRATSETSTTKALEGTDKRPLGRSKTTRDSVSGRGMLPPAVPPRKKNEVFPATFNSGTYPGFGRSVRVEGPTVGGLRQNPTSRKAEVGIPAHVLAEREKMERERLLERSSTAPLPLDTNGAVIRPSPRRTSSSSQKSNSDSKTTLSPSDETSPSSLPPYITSKTQIELLTDSIKEDFESLAERNSWLASIAERASGRPLNEARVGLMSEEDDRLDQNDEPEVDEHYLLEQRRQQQQNQWQRGNTIDVIREEESSPPGRRTPSSTPHVSLSQRRATDSIAKRSMSGVGGLAGLVRRSSLLARGSFGADDVVSSDTDDEDQTPKREKSTFLENHTNGNAIDVKAPNVDAKKAGNNEESREAEGWQQLS